MSLPSEQWRPIQGCEGRYEVSDHGRVRSLPRARTRGGVLVPARRSNGYLFVSIRRNGRRSSENIHQLVAQTFLGPQATGVQVRHLDGSKDNNALGNLRYGSQSENELDKIRHGHNPKAAKVECPQGHSYDDPDNLIVRRGHRYCRACKVDWVRQYRARRQAS